jgi:enoyl-CoA hydratase
MRTVSEVAETIAGYSKDIAMMARACVNEAEEVGLHAGVRFERQMYHALYGLPAQKEGMAAFLEKRPPRFRD